LVSPYRPLTHTMYSKSSVPDFLSLPERHEREEDRARTWAARGRWDAACHVDLTGAWIMRRVEVQGEGP
jgi:hypothetical protein